MGVISKRWDITPPVSDAGLDQDANLYKALLETTLAIPWRIDWATKEYTYMGPQIEGLLGWSQDSWQTVNDWAERIHSDERDFVVQTCITQSLAGIDHEADFRMLRKDGSFLWIRELVHVVRNSDGSVDSLIGFIMDIDEQKRAEEELLTLKKKFEALSFEDGLTGISNRRLFNDRLDTEWELARQKQSPLTMILLDIDHFKQFNDFYGHVDGDECLCLVANALNKIGNRPDDIVARYGGEEFVLLLPNTDSEAGMSIALQCQNAIAALQIPHETSSCSNIVTVSIGVLSIVPKPNAQPRMFCQSVDQLLYSAKKSGRNRIGLSSVMSDTSSP